MRNVIYHNALKGKIAMTLTGAHHSFGYFARKRGGVYDNCNRML